MIKIPKITKDIEEKHWSAILSHCFDNIVEELFKNKYNEELESLSEEKLKIINNKILEYEEFKIKEEWSELKTLSCDIIEINEFRREKKEKTEAKEKKELIDEIDGKIKKKSVEYESKKEGYLEKWKNGIIKTFCLANKEKLDLIVENFKDLKKNEKFESVMVKEYRKFRDGRAKWGAVQLIEDLGLKVCPYCNRNYLIQYKNKKSEQKIIAQIDHFYDKSTYPILALSLYNLIPSCSTCNHLKGTKKDKILYPYETGFDDKGVVFEVDNEEIAFKIKPEEEKFNIVLKNKEKYLEVGKAVDNVFYLEEMYKVHKSDVAEIFYKSRIFNKNHIEGLVEMLGKGSEKEINDIIESYEGNLNDYNKKPLSKLNYDIRNQIKNTNSQKT